MVNQASLPDLSQMEEPFHFSFRSYRRQFKRALQTSYGVWSDREGILLRLTASNGAIGFGEIAPLPWFGSETMHQALNFCKSLSDRISTEQIFSIPNKLTACQFGFESALEEIWTAAQRQGCEEARENAVNLQAKISSLSYSALLPTGEAALDTWRLLWQQGYRTFKWKIGVTKISEELHLFEQLQQAMPPQAKLRLDANGGLTLQKTTQWLEACRTANVEFLEQPLPVNQFEAMLELAAQYPTPLALDESVATLAQLETCYTKGWRSIFAIKPAIAGSPRHLRQFCQTNHLDTVFSSVFETEVGRQAALQLAAELSLPDRAVGFGIDHWFEAEVLERSSNPDSLWQPH